MVQQSVVHTAFRWCTCPIPHTQLIVINYHKGSVILCGKSCFSSAYIHIPVLFVVLVWLLYLPRFELLLLVFSKPPLWCNDIGQIWDIGSCFFERKWNINIGDYDFFWLILEPSTSNVAHRGLIEKVEFLINVCSSYRTSPLNHLFQSRNLEFCNKSPVIF